MSRYYDPMQVVSVPSGTSALPSSGPSAAGGGTSANQQETKAHPAECSSTHQWYAKNVPKLTRTNKITSPVFSVKHQLVGGNASAVAKKLKQNKQQHASATSSGSSGVAGSFFSAVSSLTTTSKSSDGESEEGAKSKEEEAQKREAEEELDDGDTEHSLWYFRMIMLKGLESAEDEADDSYGVFLEYLPGHKATDAEELKNSKLVRELDLHPHQCKVSVTVRRPEGAAESPTPGSNKMKRATSEEGAGSPHTTTAADGDADKESATPIVAPTIVSELTDVELTLEQKAVAFKTLIPGERVNKRRKKDGEEGKDAEVMAIPELLLLDGSLLVEVTIQSQLPTLADEVSEKAAQASTSFWKSVSTFGSALSNIKQSVSKQVMNQLGQLEQSREEHVHDDDTSAGGDDHLPGLPWEQVPSRWRTRAAEWHKLLTEDLPMNDYTFTQGQPERVLTSDETVMLAQVGVMAKTVMTANSNFNFDRDVHEGLLSLPMLRKQRYNLVPKYVSDESFWQNYFWKCAALGSCSTDEQSKILLTILNTPPAVPQKTNPQLEVKAEYRGDTADEETQGDSAAAHSPTSPTTAGSAAATPGSSSAPIFPPVTHGDVATMVKEASDASSLLMDLLQDEKDAAANQESNTGSGEKDPMWNTALTACQSQIKSLISVKAKIAKFAANSKQASEDQQKDIAGLATPIDTALASLEASLKAVELWERDVEERSTTQQKHPEAEKSSPTQCEVEPAVQEAKEESGSPKKVECQKQEADTTEDAGTVEVGQAHVETDEEKNQPRPGTPASWSDDDNKQDEPKKEKADAQEKEKKEKVAQAAVEAEPEVKKEEPKPQSKKAKVSKKVKKAEPTEDDGFGFDDEFPTIEDTATPLRKTGTKAAESTGKKSTTSTTGSDFSKMPWEEED